jgi:hypothetical protein
MEKLDNPSDMPTIPTPPPSIHPTLPIQPPHLTISQPHPLITSMALDHQPSAKSMQSGEGTTPLQQPPQLPLWQPQMPKRLALL